MDARQRRDARIAARRLAEEAQKRAREQASRAPAAPIPSRPPAPAPVVAAAPNASRRRHTMVELGAEFVRWDGRAPGAEHGAADAVHFECPEGHTWGNGFPCSHTVPFTPALDGTERKSPQSNGAHWKRTDKAGLEGRAGIETLTLAPSIRSSCGFHGFVQDGRIVFCNDSR